MKKINLLIAVLFIVNCTIAQSIKSEQIEYTNFKLPATPLPSSVKTFSVKIEPTYLDNNKKILDEYKAEEAKAQADYDKAMMLYREDLKSVDEEYRLAMEAYDKKSVGAKVAEKVLLNENSKPTKRTVSEPRKKIIEKPVLQGAYNFEALGSTYINLEKLERNPKGGLQVFIQMHGYDYTEPRVISQSSNVIRVGGGNVSSGTQITYSAEYSYRHPMSIKVIMPDGKELFNHTPSQLNNYKIVTINGNTYAPKLNTEIIVKNSEEVVLQDNLKFINNYLNNRFGNESEKRKAELYFVKNKNDQYTDMTIAFNNASTALRLIATDSATAREQLTTSIAGWNKLLQQADVKDNDALINKEVTIAICFNLLECNYALKNVSEAYLVLQKLNSLDLSNKERVKKGQYETEFGELKKRISKI